LETVEAIVNEIVDWLGYKLAAKVQRFYRIGGLKKRESSWNQKKEEEGRTNEYGYK
jgi:hypothetical protein